MSIEEGQGNETFKIIDEIDPSGPYNQDIPQAKEKINKFIEENRKEMLEYGEPLSEKMSEFTGKAKEWITNRLKKIRGRRFRNTHGGCACNGYTFVLKRRSSNIGC